MSNTVHVKVTLTHMQYAVLLDVLASVAREEPNQIGISARLAHDKIESSAKIVKRKDR